MIDVGLVETFHFFGIYGLKFGHIGKTILLFVVFICILLAMLHWVIGQGDT